MEIRYTKDVQPENQRIIEEYIGRARWLLPGWLHLLRVNLFQHGDEPGELASISVMYDYREATLDLCCGWLDEPPDHKLKSIVHEFIHVNLNIAATYARDKINALCPKDDNEKLNDALQTELTVRVESATHDLAKAITDRFLATECRYRPDMHEKVNGTSPDSVRVGFQGIERGRD